MKYRQNYVAIDYGTSQISVAYGRCDPNGEMFVEEVFVMESKGIEYGEIESLEDLTSCVSDLVVEAVDASEKPILSVFLSISGEFISCCNKNDKVLEIDSKGLERVKKKHLPILESMVLADGVPQEYTLINCIPNSYSINEKGSTVNPLGKVAKTLRGRYHFIYGPTNKLIDLKKPIDHIGVKFEGFYFSGLASAFAVTSLEERQGGVLVLDIGAGVTDIALFKQGELVFSGVSKIAGNMINNDILSRFSLTRNFQAEWLKQRADCSFPEYSSDDGTIVIPEQIGGVAREIDRTLLNETVGLRIYELLSEVTKKLNLEVPEWKQQLNSGIVVTGGTSELKGLAGFLSNHAELPVRIFGQVDQINSKNYIFNARYSTVTGLLKCAQQYGSLRKANASFGSRFSDWIKDIFWQS